MSIPVNHGNRKKDLRYLHVLPSDTVLESNAHEGAPNKALIEGAVMMPFASL